MYCRLHIRAEVYGNSQVCHRQQHWPIFPDWGVVTTPAGYSMRSFPRTSCGGGLAVIFRDSLAHYLSFDVFFLLHPLLFGTCSCDPGMTPEVSSFLHLPSYSQQKRERKKEKKREKKKREEINKNKLTDKRFFDEFPDLLDHCNNLTGTLFFSFFF